MIVEGTPITRYWLILTAVRPKILAYSYRGAAEDVYPTSADDIARNRRTNIEGMGPFLRSWRGMEKVCMHAYAAGTGCIRAVVEVIPPDVRWNGNFNGQRTAKESEAVGTMDGATDPEDLPGQTDARAHVSRMVASQARQIDALSSQYRISEHSKA